jgi:hypothetical protein
VSVAATLERRYRQLLVMYPAEHRRKHQDEMLGVLMTGAHAGQRWPRLADTANLIWGALLIRLRPARPGTAWPLWRDALAVVSVLLPLAFLANAAIWDITPLTVQQAGHGALALLVRETLISDAVWIVLTALVLLRLRRVAIVVTGGLLIWFVAATAGAPYWKGIDPHGMLVFAVLGLELVTLLASAGPRQGMPLMTWRYYAVAVLVPAAIGSVVDWTWPSQPFVADAAMITLVTITLAGMALATPLSRRVATVLSIPAYYLVVGYLVFPTISGPGNASGWEGPERITLTVLPFAVLIGVALAAALRSARHESAGGRAA